ncbi:MAG: hypothetical protein RIS45_849 [Planctomycetota bacterium]|jgi:hypothetical protein
MSEGAMPAQGYCVKCKAKKEIKDAKEVEMPAKGGKTRPALKGVCPDCGTGIFRILSKKQA